VHSWNDGVEGPDEVGADVRGAAGKASLGSAPMGARVTAQLRHDGRYYAEAEEQLPPGRRRRTGRGLGAAIWGEDE
jgi:WD repeat-containing protein 23